MQRLLAIDVALLPDEGSATIRVRGEVEVESAGELTDAVTAVIAGGGPLLVELDLSGVTFLDSSGVRALLTCRRLVLHSGGRLVLVEVPARVRKVLDIVELSEYFGLAGPVPAVDSDV